jgi:histidinol-phosphate aminotransferase
MQKHNLSANENPFGPSPKALDAINSVLYQLNLYPPSDDSGVTARLANHFQRGLKASNFLVGNGVIDIINLIEQISFKENQSNSIVICPPCFVSYAATAKLRGAEVIEHPLQESTFDIDSVGLLNSIRPDTRLVYLCNPNNPTGTYFDQKALDQILDKIPANVLLVYDEVYNHFVTEPDLPDAIQSVLDNHNIIILHSLSKVYGLAGIRAGYAIASECLVKKLRKQKLFFQDNRISLAAMEATIGDIDFVQKVVINNTTQREWLETKLTQLGLHFYPSQANFICIKAPGKLSATKVIEHLARFSILVSVAFYLPDHIRVSIGLPESNKQFIVAMEDLMNQLKSGDSGL